MSLSIRDARPEDDAALIELIRALQRHEGAIFDRMRPAEAIGEWYLEHMRKECAESAGRIFIAERDGAAIGYATVLTGLSSKDEADEIEYRYALVAEISVAPEARGGGVGQALLARCEEAARGAGAPWLRIVALAGNDLALRAYERFGFRPLGINLEKPVGPGQGQTFDRKA